MADRAAAASARRGLSYQPPGPSSCCTIRTAILGRCCFCSLLRTATGMISGRGCTSQEGSRFAHRPSPGGPGRLSSPVPCLSQRAQFSDWSGLWRRHLHGLSSAVRSPTNLEGGFFLLQIPRRSPPLSLIRGKPAGRRSRQQSRLESAPRLRGHPPNSRRLGSGELQVKPGAFDVVEQMRFEGQHAPNTQHNVILLWSPAVHIQLLCHAQPCPWRASESS